jgi:hypothetical protein
MNQVNVIDNVGNEQESRVLSSDKRAMRFHRQVNGYTKAARIDLTRGLPVKPGEIVECLIK